MTVGFLIPFICWLLVERDIEIIILFIPFICRLLLERERNECDFCFLLSVDSSADFYLSRICELKSGICGSGGTCVNTWERNGYICNCSNNRSGHLCEKSGSGKCFYQKNIFSSYISTSFLAKYQQVKDAVIVPAECIQSSVLQARIWHQLNIFSPLYYKKEFVILYYKQEFIISWWLFSWQWTGTCRQELAFRQE